MSSPRRVKCKGDHLILESIISLILRYTRPIESSSTTCIVVPDLLIISLSARLRSRLKDPNGQELASNIQELTSPVPIRREKKVVLELSLHSDSHQIGYWGWGGIQLPQTRSVESGQQGVPRNLLRVSIQGSGWLTDVPNIQPCPRCWERERQRIDPNVFPPNLEPYMINFQANNPVTLLSGPSDGSHLNADIAFHFTCYSPHGESYR